MALPATCQIDGKRRTGVTVDIGARGMLVEIDVAGATGLLTFEVEIPGSARRLQLSGYVVRATPTSVAVSFSDGPETIRNAFRQVLLELNPDPVFAARLELHRRFYGRHLSENLSLHCLSVVVPVFNEREGIREFHRELTECLNKLVRWEIIYVDDGSTDGSLEILREIVAEGESVRVLSLSRNFGHQAALLAGIEASTGAAIVTMDADLQHPPELIGNLIEKWKEGFDVVHTIRASTENDGFFKRATSRGFYWFFNKMSELSIHNGMADFRLLDRNVVDILLSLPERQVFLRGLAQWVGYQRCYVKYTARARARGTTKFSTARMFSMAADGVMSFSFFPLRISLYLGISSLLITFAVMVYVAVALITDISVRGWASLLLIGSFFAGLQMTVLGFVAEYVGRIFVETKRRPRYILKDVSGIEEPVFAALAEYCQRKRAGARETEIHAHAVPPAPS